MNKYTIRLFALPTVLSGASRIFDLGCTFDRYNTSESGEIADFLSIASDFAAVGEDLASAIVLVQDESQAESDIDERKDAERETE